MKNVITTISIFLISLLSLQAQEITKTFFDEVDAFMRAQVTKGTLDYAALKNSSELKNLMQQIKDANLSTADDATKKAFYINAYNLGVIDQVTHYYPLASVQQVKGFFDGNKMTVNGKNTTLNDLEKKELLSPYKDGRLHFVLVCGALGCPPITNFAYRPELLDAQLDKQTRLALNDPNFIQTSKGNIGLSQIFKWYPTDFGKNIDGVIDFINEYREVPLSKSAKVSYYNYDWSLNEKTHSSSSSGGATSASNNSSRYIVSSTIPQGSVELKIFNNLYTQRTGFDGENFSDRGNFFTTSISALYGLHSKFNIGINTRFRRVSNAGGNSSPFQVLGNGEAFSRRQGITAFGPQIRYAPVDAWSNFSIQSSFVFAIGEELQGNSTQPFIDWNGATWNTQFFNDFPVGNNFSLFTEIDLLIEDIGKRDDGHINRISTPVTAIFSYNPNAKTTLYAISGFSPFWQADFDYFYQYGAGAKYQFTPDVELELLVTDFINKFLRDTSGDAATFNVGFRINI